MLARGWRPGPYVIMSDHVKETSDSEDTGEWQHTALGNEPNTVPPDNADDSKHDDGGVKTTTIVIASAAAAAVALYIAAGARRAST